MKKVGKQVLFLPAGNGVSRNGEGDMIRLKNGDILYAYTLYYTADWEDHAPSRICGVLSHDEGESFGEPFVLLEKDPEAQNIMSVSLLRLADGALGMAYLRKSYTADKRLLCMPMFVRSEDEGKSWSKPVVTMPEGYYCGINGGALVLKSGKIVYPFSFHGSNGAPGYVMDTARVRFACSDDNGKTWEESFAPICTPFGDDHYGLGEPGLYELPDGSLWCYARTAYGHQYEARSTDGGKSWSKVLPNVFFTSPDAPMRVRDFETCAVAVFNPFGFNCTRDLCELWRSPKRTPLVFTVDPKHGEGFDMTGKTAGNGQLSYLTDTTYLLETDPADSYCYPSVTRVRDGFLVCYYHSNGTPVCLNSAKIVKIYDEEIGL